jgi:hypothetical protein
MKIRKFHVTLLQKVEPGDGQNLSGRIMTYPR